MKIALSACALDGARSGVGQYVVELVRALLSAADQHEFAVFALEKDLPHLAFAAGAMQLEPVAERHRPPLRNIAWHQTRLPGLLKAGRFDVVHVPTYRRMLGFAPCARVATIHDLAPFHLRRKYGWARGVYGRVVARRLARLQDDIIAVSARTAADITRHFGIPPSRISVIHNGVDHRRFSPGPAAEARNEVCAPRGLLAPFFLYVSRLEHPAKNHLPLIDAFDRFKARTGSPWELVLAGADWSGAEAIHERIRRSPNAAHIRALGFVPSSDLPSWYRAAGALVYPSLFEGFGLPAIEAMASGCPVLCSRRGALGEVVGAAAGTLEPSDIAQMSDALARVAQDAAERERLRRLGLERARQFDWGRTAAATLAVYVRAADRSRRAARWIRDGDLARPSSAPAVAGGRIPFFP